mgnify:CR=1 FL=1
MGEIKIEKNRELITKGGNVSTENQFEKKGSVKILNVLRWSICRDTTYLKKLLIFFLQAEAGIRYSP